MAHGSRNPEANEDLFFFAEEMKKRGEYHTVQASFLELAGPSIEEGGVQCVEKGAGLVIMLPFFLSAGIHVRRDLAEIRDALANKFPEVKFQLAEPMGRHPLLLDVIQERAQAAEF